MQKKETHTLILNSRPQNLRLDVLHQEKVCFKIKISMEYKKLKNQKPHTHTPKLI